MELSAVVGNVIRLTHTVTNLAGAAEDAETVVFTVHSTASTTVSDPITGAPVVGENSPHPETGTYRYDYKIVTPGTHNGYVVATNPDSAAKVEFYAEESGVT